MSDNSSQVSPAVLDLYKMAVEMADRLSSRRGTANAFFLTVQTTFVAVLGVATPNLAKSPWGIGLTVSLAGVALSATWWMQLRSYRDLNQAKFKVINKIEEQLPFKVFSDEWEYLKKDPIRTWRSRYAELGASERAIPWVFAILHALMFIGRFWG
ncbi:RipA family octameric membrane protein [Microbispora hainanensis]|uniref:RipA family octameric membrane protein n=1 Tax=Microbispora hainanensis TaxID=568844 RepID=UPI0033D31239